MRRMGQLHLSKGWVTWQAWHAHRTWQLEQMRKSLVRVVHGDLVRSLDAWREWYEERMHRIRLLQGTAHRVANRNYIRGLEGWHVYVEYPSTRPSAVTPLPALYPPLPPYP